MPIDPYLGEASDPLNMVQAAFEAFGISPSQNADLFDSLYNEAKAALASGASKFDLYPFMLEKARQISNPGVPPEGYLFDEGFDPYGSGGGAAGGGAGGGALNDGGYDYGTLSQYLGSFQDQGLLQVGTDGSPYIILKDKAGKTVQAYQQDPETGRYYPIGGAAGGGGGGFAGGGGGGGGSDSGRLALAGQEFERGILESDRQFGETQRQFDARLGLDQQQLGENARQFDASNQRLNLSDVASLGLDLGRLSLEQQKYIGQILREPADFLARAFSQRGGQSPFPEITQADLINKLSTEMGNIRKFTGGEMAARLPLSPVAPKTPLQAPQPRIPLTNTGPAPLPISQTGYPGPATIYRADGSQVTYDPVQGMPEDPANYQAIADNANNLFQPDASGQDFNFFVDEGGTLRAEPRARGTMGDGGPVRDRISLVGEEGPEMLFNHGDGSFDIANNEQTMDLLNSGMIDVPGLMDRSSDVTVTEHRDGTKSKRQIRFLLSKGSPLSGGQKTKLKGELHSGAVKGYREGTVEEAPSDEMFPLGEDPELFRLAYALEQLLTDPGMGETRPMSRQRMLMDDRRLSNAEGYAGNNPDGSARAAMYAGGTLVNSKKRMKVDGYQDGTLNNLTPDALSRLSLFDVATPQQTTQQQLLDYARQATPPGVAAVAAGQAPPPLDVTTNSSFKLFSPTQYMSLTPDEQAALGTRLASENKSLSDYLYSSQRNFAGRPREQRRARFDVTS